MTKKQIFIAGIFLLLFILKTKAHQEPVCVFDEKIWEKEIGKMRTEFGKNKHFLPELELPALIALSYYDELKDIDIRFLYANTHTTMETRPKIIKMLCGFKRVYVIRIDNNTEGEGVLFDDIPFNARIGILAHELAHIVDYENRSKMNILHLGIAYLNKTKRAIFEKSIDDIVVKHKLGWQLYDWSDFVLYKSRASVKYKTYKKQHYMTPTEIECSIHKCGF